MLQGFKIFKYFYLNQTHVRVFQKTAYLYKLLNDKIKQIHFTEIIKCLLFNQILSMKTSVKVHC